MGVDVVPVKCCGCNRSVNVPSALVRANKKAGRPTIVFCSAVCNKMFVSKEGERWKRR